MGKYPMFISQNTYYHKDDNFCQINLQIQHNPGHKSSRHFFVETQKLVIKHAWNFKEPRIFKARVRKYKAVGFTLSDFKTYCNSAVINTVWYWSNQREKERWDNREGSK